jgi:hypothetical protein
MTFISLGSGNPVAEEMLYSFFFSLPPLHLTLACIGKEEGHRVV